MMYQLTSYAEALNCAKSLLNCANQINDLFADQDRVSSMLIGGDFDGKSAEEVDAFYREFRAKYEPIYNMIKAYHDDLTLNADEYQKSEQQAGQIMSDA